MASTTFTDNLTVIRASWLNDVDATVYTIRNSGPLSGFRNRIINGDMRIDQRNAGAALVPVVANTYTVDRLLYASSQAGKFNFQQNANANATVPGFPYYAGFVVAASFTPAAGDFFNTAQRVEGANIADFAWGTASAKAVTVSFWAQSSVTGQHSGSLINGAFTYSYPFTFSLPVANTWTYIQIQVPGPTAGTWTTTSALGLSVVANLGSGANFLGASGAWVAANLHGVTGSVKVVSAANANTFFMTGLQLELGSVATPFEQRPIGTELSLSQRYYQVVSGQLAGYTTSGCANQYTAPFPVPMRASPTATLIGSATNTNTTGATTVTVSASHWQHSSTGAALGVFTSAAQSSFSAEL